MNTKLTSFAHASICIALGLALIPATAQTPRAQSEKELSRKAPVDGVQACSLITRADVSKATGRDPYVDPEPAGQGGLQEGQGTADANLRRRGARLFPLPKPDNEYQGNVAFLVAKSGNHMLALSLDAPKGSSADSMRPALESLMKTVLARLP